jgi:catechol 2,3-dioxygenase-like lactoylglutathione lyase family enzyme
MPRGGEPKARAFYGDLLGLAEVPKPPNLAARGGVWFRCGSIQVHLGTEEDFRPARKAHPAFLVRDLEQVLEELVNAGHEVKRDPEPNPGYERAFTSDPFGNRVELMQPHEGSAQP